MEGGRTKRQSMRSVTRKGQAVVRCGLAATSAPQLWWWHCRADHSAIINFYQLLSAPGAAGVGHAALTAARSESGVVMVLVMVVMVVVVVVVVVVGVKKTIIMIDWT